MSDGSSSVAVTVTVFSPTSACSGAAVMTPVAASMVANPAPEIEYASTASGSSSEKYEETSMVVEASSSTTWLGTSIDVGSLSSTPTMAVVSALTRVVALPSVSLYVIDTWIRFPVSLFTRV